MKTTVEISDTLFERAKRHSKKVGKPMRALIEEGLRRILEADEKPAPYRMPDLSVGKAGKANPLEAMTWQDVRDAMYGGS